MPRKLELTFQKGTGGRLGRWRKKYRGKVHYLGSGRSKSDLDSYRKAMTAWKTLKDQLDREVPAEPGPFDADYAKTIQEWEAVLAWAMQHGDEAEASAAREKLVLLRGRRSITQQEPVAFEDRLKGRFQTEPKIMAAIVEMALAETKSSTSDDWENFRRGFSKPPALIGNPNASPVDDVPHSVQEEIRWMDRIDSQQQQSDQQDDSLETWVTTYLQKRRERVAAGDLSAGRYKAHEVCIHFFRDWLGSTTAVASINGRTLSSYHSFLLEQVSSEKCASGYAGDRLTAVRSFVRWLWGQDAIENLPKNIDSRELRITRRATTPKVFTIDEVGQLVTKAEGRTRLYVLLALNTGMTQKDIADLLDDEVDFNKGKLTRKRSKTQRHEGVPTVTYKLWPETLELLVKYRSGQDRVLLNSHGEPLFKEWLDEDGKYKKNDNIRNAFDRVMAKLNFRKSLKLLRKTSPSLLDDDERYRGLGQLFLGQAPSNVADKFYLLKSESVLDNAIDFLRTTYRIEQVCKASEDTED